MTEFGFRRALEFWDNALRQHLPKLHAPLIERVDLPNNTLREDQVLVKGDEFAESFRREPIG